MNLIRIIPAEGNVCYGGGIFDVSRNKAPSWFIHEGIFFAFRLSRR
jgi:hypothetical protein